MSSAHVGIVIPLYNKGPYIERAVRSVLAQTHGDWRLVVVDDGSKDDGPARVEASADPRITVSRYPNGGVSMARNRGIDELDTEWVAFLDADDEWKPRLLEDLLAAVMAHPKVVAVGANRFSVGENRPLLRRMPEKPGVLEDYFAACVADDATVLHSSCCLIRRSRLQAAGGFPLGVWHAEDSDTWMRLAWLGSIAYVPEVLAVYHDETPGNTMAAMPPHGWGFPVHTRTFRRWRERIPPDLLASSRRYVANEVLIHAGRLLHYGARLWALEMLARNVSWGRQFPAAYRWLVLRALLGERLARRYGEWRRHARDVSAGGHNS